MKFQITNAFLAFTASTLLLTTETESLDVPRIRFDINKDDISRSRLLPDQEDRYLEKRDFVSLNDVTITDSSIFSSGRYKLWSQIWNKIDSYKSNREVWDMNSQQRPTLTKCHFFILPVRWQGATIKDYPPLDMSLMVPDFDKNIQYYRDMSWNKHQISYEIYQATIDLIDVTADNANFDNSEKAARDFITSIGKKKDIDFSGISIIYKEATAGPFAGSGGWANLNGPFMWQSFNSGFEVKRHEVGHMYGHPHHMANIYKWRLEEFTCDGFDMMSCGNGYEISDIAAASKWFFNWIPNDSIVKMQPEGPNDFCPTCIASIENLVLYSFDDRSINPSEVKTGVHIPITSQKNDLYSYWLSYRGASDNPFSASGLSIHFGWFEFGGHFGASYDSMNYDAYGDSESTVDSFVLPGTCYVVTPSAKGMHIDPKSMEQIQPVVCVQSISKPDKSITISVSFLDPTLPPSSTVSLQSNELMTCSISGGTSRDIALDMTSRKPHLFRYSGTGSDGKVTLSLCRVSENSPLAQVYVYDRFPVSYMSYGSPPAYGSFMSMDVLELCSSSSTNDLTYQSDYGEVYVLVIPDALTDPSIKNDSITFRSTCQLNQCGLNEYLDGSVCVACPPGHLSSAGATRIGECISCTKDGLEVEHSRARHCTITTTTNPDVTSKSWRLMTHEKLKPGNYTDYLQISAIKMFSTETCDRDSLIDVTQGVAFASGTYNDYWGETKPFVTEDRPWYGIADKRNLYWIGMTFPSDITVRCVRLNQKNFVESIYVQALNVDTDNWQTAWIGRDLGEGSNTFTVNGQSAASLPTSAPTSLPTSSPTSLPTRRPTRRPTRSPTIRPKRIPTRRPTRRPITRRTRRPITRRTRRPIRRPTSRP